MAITPVHATKTITTAGTRLQAETDADYRPSSIYFEAAGANTGYIYIGLVTVSSTIYITRLAAGQGFTLSADGAGAMGYRAGSQGLQLSAIYGDSSVNGEKYQMTYMYPTGA